MAGNTKLMGFLKDNRIQLERWGVTEIVTLPESATRAIREACFQKLPRTAPSFIKEPGWNRAEYDKPTGTGVLCCTIETVGKLLTYLKAHVVEVDVDQTLTRQEHQFWISELEELLEEHRQYNDRANEPGIE